MKPKTVVFNEKNQHYYVAKKARIELARYDRGTIQEDARFVLAYGMDAYMKLFPDAINQPSSWHTELLLELERLKRIHTASELSGIAMAIAANMNKKSNRHFTKYIKDLIQ